MKQGSVYNPSITNAPIGAFVELIPQDSYRSLVQIQNKGEDNIFLYFGEGTPTELSSIEMGPGDYFDPFIPPTSRIRVATLSTATVSSDVLLLTNGVTNTSNS